MDESHRMLVAAAAICIHWLLLSFVIIFDDVPMAYETRAAKRCKRELRHTKETCQWNMVRQQPTLSMFHI